MSAASVTTATAADSKSTSVPTITYYRCASDLAAGRALAVSEVSATRGVLKSDKTTRVLIKCSESCGSGQPKEYTFVRIPIGELRGQTAFYVWIAGKGRFYVYSCQPPLGALPDSKLLWLNLESSGGWPVEGATTDKLINVLSDKLWPIELTQ